MAHFAEHPSELLPGCQSDPAGFWPFSAAACPSAPRWLLGKLLQEWQRCSALCPAAPLVCGRLGEGQNLLPGKVAGLLLTSSSSLLAETLSREGNIFQLQEKQQREAHRGTADIYTTAPSLLSTVQRQWRRLPSSACDPEPSPSLRLHI